MILGVRTKGKLVISKGEVKVENAVVEMQLQKMKPPTFSGKIRYSEHSNSKIQPRSRYDSPNWSIREGDSRSHSNR